MDFSQVKAITIPEGSVNRILSGSTVLWKKRTGLPAEYQEVEYLESTGTQYIDTGYYPNQDTVLNGKYYSDNRAGNIATARWSRSPQYDTFGFYVGGTGLTTVYYGRYSDGKYSSNIGGMTNIDVDISIGITSITLNNDQYTINRDQFQSSCSLYLFAGNNMGVLTTPAYCKIYRMTIIENNVTMRDFIPCYRKIDKKPGLYDITNGVFYTNAGTGEFNVGADVIVLPADYQRVEYIESTGTQYINTGIASTRYITAHLDMQFTEYSSSSMIIIAWSTGAGRWFGKGGLNTYSAGNNAVSNVDALLRKEIDVTFTSSNISFVIDGTTYSKAATSSQSNGYTMFAGRNVNTGVSFYASAKLYKATIQENGETIRDLVPCYRKIDKKPGLYDITNGVFYTNDGTGEFNVGADVIVLPVDYQRVEYIQSSGTQYIRTSVPPSDNFRMDLKLFTTCTDSFYCAGLRVGGNIIFGQTGPTANNRVSASVNGSSVTASTDGVLWSRNSSGQIYEIMLRTNGNGTFTYHIEDLTNKKEYLAENQSYNLMGDVTYGICVSSLNSVYILNGTNQFYYFRLYKNGEIAFDGIPCYRRSDNVAGLYDLVTGTFFTNSGSGTFAVGPII